MSLKLGGSAVKKSVSFAEEPDLDDFCIVSSETSLQHERATNALGLVSGCSELFDPDSSSALKMEQAFEDVEAKLGPVLAELRKYYCPT